MKSSSSNRTLLILSVLSPLMLWPSSSCEGAGWVRAWGDNTYGQTNVPPDLTNVIAITAGRDHCLALRSDNRVVAWGKNNVGQTAVPAEATNIVAIAAGNAHSLALAKDGKIIAWGHSFYGQTVVPIEATNVAAIAAGYYHSFAIRRDGTVVAWGNNTDWDNGTWTGQATVPEGLSNVVAASGGYHHSLVLKSDGTVHGWGAIDPEQVEFISGLTNIVAIAGAWSTSYALNESGTITGNGRAVDSPSEFDSATNQVALSAISTHVIGLSERGLVGHWPADHPPALPGQLQNAIQVAAGKYHGLALIGDGSPFFSVHPFYETANSGNDLKLRSFALGTEPVSYQWQRGGTNLIGETNATLALCKVQATDIGDYVVIASNQLGSTRSQIGHLSVVDNPPTIAAQPESQEVWSESNVMFSINTEGSLPQTFQWMWDGKTIPNATNPVLEVPNVKLGNGSYRVIVGNAFGSVSSESATLVVKMKTAAALDNYELPFAQAADSWFGQTNVTFDNEDALQTLAVGDSQSCIIQTVVTGPGTLAFWWKVSSEEDADYFKCEILPVFTQATISGEVDWQQVFVPIPDGTRTIRWRYAKNTGGSAGEDAGWLDQVTFSSEGQVPQIVVSPVSQTVLGGTNFRFTVAATGEIPLGYQWLKDGVVIEEATDPILAFSNLTRRHSGNYSVIVSNIYDCVISDAAQLIVKVPQRLSDPECLTEGKFRFYFGDVDEGSMAAIPIEQFEIWTSTNLIDWILTPGTISISNDMLRLEDFTNTNHQSKFYRVIEP